MTFIKKNHKNRKIYFLWLASYFSIFIIPIIMSSVFYFTSISTVEREMLLKNFTMLNQMKQVIDYKLIETQSVGQQISFDPAIQKIMQMKSAFKIVDRDSVVQALQNFGIYRASTKSFKDFYIIFNNIDLCLSSSGEYSKKVFRDTMVVHNKQISEDSWVRLTDEKNKNGFSVLAKNKIGNKCESNLAYICSLPIMEFENPLATVLVEVDMNELMKMLNNIASANRSIAYIVNKDDVILTTTSDSEIIHKIKFDELKEESNLIYTKHGFQELAVSYIKSDVSDWKYVSITPKNVFSEKLEYLKNISYICYLLSFVIGIFMTFYLLRKNYKPVRELMGILSGNEVSQSNKDEFHFIRDLVTKTIREKKTIKEQLEKQNESNKYSFLSTLIRGRISNNISIKKAFEEYHITQLSNYYSIILFRIEDFSGFVDSEEMNSSVENMDLIQFVIRNVVEELATRKHLGYVTEVDNMFCCLVNLAPDRSEDLQMDLYHIANETLQVFKENLQIYLTASISEVLKDISGINIAYKQALEAMEYRLLTGGNKILPYSYIKENNKNNFYEYTLEMENQIINCVKMGNYETAERILNDVFDKNFINDSPSIHMAKFLMYELMSTIMKAMREVNIVYDNYFLDEMDSIESLRYSNDILGIKNEILNTVRKVCNYINDRKKSHNEHLKDDILNLIEDKFSEMNLNLQFISDELNVSNSYLSKFFKEQMGTRFVDYLHMIRIKKAKEMLHDNRLSITDIATRTGYCNCNTFIRAFKKSEGIAPGQYRDNM